MNKRLQLSITEREGAVGLWASVAKASLLKVRTFAEPLNVQMCNALLTAQQLADHGAEIRDALMSHSQISKVLGVIGLAAPGDPWNLLFEVSGTAAEAIRWETLLDAYSRHVAIDVGRRLFRVAADPGAPDLRVRNFPVPICMVAVLSPARVDPGAERAELAAVLSAVAGARLAGLHIELTVYLGKTSLIDELAGQAGVTAKPIPSSTLELQAELRSLQPHVLHFFCHGTTVAPQELQFATILDVMRGSEMGSVLFSIDRLVRDPVILQRAWVVLFNCCDGGRPADALNSMAFRAVAEAGVPAAIGMGAPLAMGAAPIFSHAFYGALMGTIRSVAAQTDRGVAEVDFGDAIVEGRMALHQAIVGCDAPSHCWSLPVIYLHPDEFLMQKPLELPPAPVDLPQQGAPRRDETEIAARVATISDMLRFLPVTTPLEVRKAMVALFDQEPVVPPIFRCDEFGRVAAR